MLAVSILNTSCIKILTKGIFMLMTGYLPAFLRIITAFIA
jgi:hypothetical protein